MDRTTIRQGATFALLMVSLGGVIFGFMIANTSSGVTHLGNTSGDECKIVAHYENGSTETIESTTNESGCEMIAELPQTMEEHERQGAMAVLRGYGIVLASIGMAAAAVVVSPHVQLRDQLRSIRGMYQ